MLPDCHCGSGLRPHALTDARGIFCAYVCTKCEMEVKQRYRPEVFTDPNYDASEAIEED